MGKRKRATHPPVVYVEWHDSRHLASKWINQKVLLSDATKDYDDCPTSAGFLLEINKKYLVIASSIGGGNGDAAEVMQIPRSEVRMMKVLLPNHGYKRKRVRGSCR